MALVVDVRLLFVSLHEVRSGLFEYDSGSVVFLDAIAADADAVVFVTLLRIIMV